MEGRHGLGIEFDLVVHRLQSGVHDVLGAELELFRFVAGVVETGPGVGETGDVGGIIFIFADFGDGLEEERADEAIGAVARIGLVGASDGGAELFGVFDEAEELFAFGLVVEPAGVGGGVPAGEGAFAEALRGDGLIGVAAQRRA